MDKNTPQSKPRLCGSAKNYWCPFFYLGASCHFLRVFSKKRLSGTEDSNAHHIRTERRHDSRADAQDVLYRASLPDQRFRGENARCGGSSHAVAWVGGLPGLVQALNGSAMREVIPRRDLRRQSVHRSAI